MVDRFNIFPAAKVIGNPAPGYTSGQALAAMEEVARQTLPAGYTIGWTGSAFQEMATGGHRRARASCSACSWCS